MRTKEEDEKVSESASTSVSDQQRRNEPLEQYRIVWHWLWEERKEVKVSLLLEGRKRRSRAKEDATTHPSTHHRVLGDHLDEEARSSTDLLRVREE